MKQRFYSNGKLFITGEYVVLDGAIAFALPTKSGQDLVVEEGNNQEISWKSFDNDGKIWFEDVIQFSEVTSFQPTETKNVRETLVTILHFAHQLNPEIINSAKGFIVETNLTFPRKWGLGTSSTLINNIANWFKIDPFVLLRNSFGGSGYDIACARNDSAILYRLENGNPVIRQISFKPEFHSKLYFVYLNKKQNSKSAIASYREKIFDRTKLVQEIDKLTEITITASNINEFRDALEKHENVLSEVLDIKPVKQNLFPDFNGTVKSLGAWGGDFVLAISEENPAGYFRKKGYGTIIPYSQMIL